MVELRLKDPCRLAVRYAAALICAVCLLCVPLTAFADDGAAGAQGADRASQAMVEADLHGDETAAIPNFPESGESSHSVEFESTAEVDYLANTLRSDAVKPFADANVATAANSDVSETGEVENTGIEESAGELSEGDGQPDAARGGEAPVADGRTAAVTTPDEEAEAAIEEGLDSSAGIDDADGTRLGEPVENGSKQADAPDGGDAVGNRQIDADADAGSNAVIAAKSMGREGANRTDCVHANATPASSIAGFALSMDEAHRDLSHSERGTAVDEGDAPGAEPRSAKPSAEDAEPCSPQLDSAELLEAVGVGRGAPRQAAVEVMVAAPAETCGAIADEGLADRAESLEAPAATDEHAPTAASPAPRGFVGFALSGTTGGLPLVPPEVEVSVRLAQAFSQVDGFPLLTEEDSVRVALRSWRCREHVHGEEVAGERRCTRCRSPSLHEGDAD